MPWSYAKPPEDGYIDFDFLATPPKPGTFVTQGFAKISSMPLSIPIDVWVMGVRIHASSNKLEIGLNSDLQMEEKLGFVGEDPTPWPWTIEEKA